MYITEKKSKIHPDAERKILVETDVAVPVHYAVKAELGEHAETVGKDVFDAGGGTQIRIEVGI